MAYKLDDKLVVGISSRALFDLDAADRVYRTQGLAAFRSYQRARETEALEAGPAMPLVRALLRLNDLGRGRFVEVLVISRNDPDVGTRVLTSAAEQGLDITRAAFTGGQDPWPYLEAFNCKLFLTAEAAAVGAAISAGFAAAHILPSASPDKDDHQEVRIAFDGDAVLFDEASEEIFQRDGLDAFLEHEASHADEPMNPGPFKPFLDALVRIQVAFAESPPIRTALVTARNAPAHRRVVNTLRSWGLSIDEAFYLGGIDKAKVIEIFQPQIFLDDQMVHIRTARTAAPAGHVRYEGRQQVAFSREETPEAPLGATPKGLEVSWPNQRGRDGSLERASAGAPDLEAVRRAMADQVGRDRESSTSKEAEASRPRARGSVAPKPRSR